MKILLSLFACGFLQAVAIGGEVNDQSTWVGGGETVTIDVDPDALSGGTEVDVSFRDSSGTSGTVTGSPGDHNTAENPTCDSSAEATTPDGSKFRVSPDGKVQRKNGSGQWVNMKRKGKKGVRGLADMWLRAGEPAPKDGVLLSPTHPPVPLLENEPAPWAGYLALPGEDVTSLPGGP